MKSISDFGFRIADLGCRVRPSSLRRFVASSLLFLVPGCEEQPQPPVIEHVQGTITKIDSNRRLVTLTFFRKESARNEQILARVSPECEIDAQGIISTFDRLRVGQMVTAFATVEHFSDGDMYHLLKLHLSEPASSSVSPKGRPQQ